MIKSLRCYHSLYFPSQYSSTPSPPAQGWWQRWGCPTSGKQIICRHKRPLIKTTITWHKVEQMSWTDLPQSLSPFTSRTSSGNQCLSYDGDDLACGFHHQRQHHQQHHPRHQPPPGWRLPLRSAAPPLTTLPITTRSPSFRTWLRSAVSWWSRWWSMAMVLKMVVYADRVFVFVFIWTVGDGCLGIWSTPPEADYGWSYLCCHNHHCLALIEFII